MKDYILLKENNMEILGEEDNSRDALRMFQNHKILHLRQEWDTSIILVQVMRRHPDLRDVKYARVGEEKHD